MALSPSGRGTPRERAAAAAAAAAAKTPTPTPAPVPTPSPTPAPAVKATVTRPVVNTKAFDASDWARLDKLTAPITLTNPYGIYKEAPNLTKEQRQAALAKAMSDPVNVANKAERATWTEQEKRIDAQNNRLEKYGVTSADLGNKILTDDELQKVEDTLFYKVNDTQFENLKNLQQSNPAEFSTIFNQLDNRKQLTYFYNDYKAGNLNKDSYLQAAAGLLQSQNPNSIYLIDQGVLYEAPKNVSKSLNNYREVNLLDPTVSGGVKKGTDRTDPLLLGNLGSSVGGTSLDKRSSWDKVLNSAPMSMVASVFGPAGQAVLAAAKLANGQSLTTADYIQLASAGLKYLGTLEGATLAEAQSAADAAVESAIAAGTITTAAEADAMYNSVLAATEMAPNVFGVTFKDLLGTLGEGAGAGTNTNPVDIFGNAASTDGIIYNLLGDSVGSSITDLLTDTTGSIFDRVNEIGNQIQTEGSTEQAAADARAKAEAQAKARADAEAETQRIEQEAAKAAAEQEAAKAAAEQEAAKAAAEKAAQEQLKQQQKLKQLVTKLQQMLKLHKRKLLLKPKPLQTLKLKQIN
jgi:hypothetical protein